MDTIELFESLFYEDECGDCCWGAQDNADDDSLFACKVWGLNDDEDEIDFSALNF